MKPKGVTTQMKALDEYFLMVVFMLLLNRVHVFANFIFGQRETREDWLNSDTLAYSTYQHSPLGDAWSDVQILQLGVSFVRIQDKSSLLDYTLKKRNSFKFWHNLFTTCCHSVTEKARPLMQEASSHRPHAKWGTQWVPVFTAVSWADVGRRVI